MTTWQETSEGARAGASLSELESEAGAHCESCSSVEPEHRTVNAASADADAPPTHRKKELRAVNEYSKM